MFPRNKWTSKRNPWGFVLGRKKAPSKKRSFKSKPFLRKGSYSSKFRKGRARTFSAKRKFRPSLKKTVYKMSRKLQYIPTPAVRLVQECYQKAMLVPQGYSLLHGLGGVASVTSYTSGATSSPEDVLNLCVGPLNNSGSSSLLGTSKGIITKWRTSYRFTLQTNVPMELKFYTLKCIKDMPLQLLATAGASQGTMEHYGLHDIMNWWANKQYNAGGTWGNTATSFANSPLWEFQDLNEFKQYFRVKRVIRKTLMSARPCTITKFRNTPRIYDETHLFDPVSTTVKLACKKGTLHYIWRLTATAGAGTSTEDDDVNLLGGHVGVLQHTHWWCSYLQKDNYGSVVPGSLVTAVTPKFYHYPTNTYIAHSDV